MGFCTCSIVHAMVADLPDPVIPSSVWKRSPRLMPSLSAAIAVGWSPAGANEDTTRNGRAVGTSSVSVGSGTAPS